VARGPGGDLAVTMGTQARGHLPSRDGRYQPRNVPGTAPPRPVLPACPQPSRGRQRSARLVRQPRSHGGAGRSAWSRAASCARSGL